MVKAAGCTYAIVAHSERRQLFGETLESSGKRVAAALRAGLTPIFCVGEVLEEREAGKTLEVVAEQLDAGIQALDSEALARVVVAYEPVWAIGTGKVATPAQAQEVHAMIRERVRTRDAGIAETMRILYGGSMKPDNAAELLAQADIDGGLVGGASLKAESFAAIVKARPAR
jgi:triosephosphate isomerase